jgi:patatin-like phospholipase/acyl hydrolase
VHSTDPRVTNRWHPEYFHNFDHSENADTPVMDVVLRTTAAPSYFPVYQGMSTPLSQQCTHVEWFE